MDENQFRLESPAFENRSIIPEDYTCHGKNLSPPLRWKNVPSEAKELVLICEDPDAPKNPPFIHWVAYGISPKQTELREGVIANMNQEFSFGRNSNGEMAYMGPRPPEGTGMHRYYFRLFAVDCPVELQPGSSAEVVMESIVGHVIGEAELVGRHSFH